VSAAFDLDLPHLPEDSTFEMSIAEFSLYKPTPLVNIVNFSLIIGAILINSFILCFVCEFWLMPRILMM
jgi:hypothetical protein